MTKSKPARPDEEAKHITGLDYDFAKSVLSRIAFIRAFEAKVLELSQANPPIVVGSTHLCAGQEAVPLGAVAALHEDDQIISTYRGHGWAIAAGLVPQAVMAEICHRATGINGGRAGSAYFMAPDTRFIGVRTGNVLASRGSVIPVSHDQIRNGGPVTITAPHMTRFLLSLDQAVDTVFAALKGAKAGEIYVPNAPSATVINIAKALIGNRKVPTKITGVRPGEKLHEIMVSEEEVHHCVKRGAWYAIRPMLPELTARMKTESNALKHEFSSADNVLPLAGTVQLLKQHRLMPGDAGLDDGELLR